MARRQELCQTLNMNFDEADELFSTETLSSMTMAKVNGGIIWIPYAIKGLIWVGGAVGSAVIGYYVNEIMDGPTKDANSSDQPSGQQYIMTVENGQLRCNGTLMDSTIFRYVNGRIEIASYPASPTPTSAWQPPMQ